MNRPRDYSVFLSYASEDRAAAAVLAAALRADGVAVWFDQDELQGGDAWDATIRQRINDCTYFVPLISHTTQARAEGYFRREWKFAIERSEGMAEDRAFLIPVNLDAIPEASARVPGRFRELHWITLARGTPGTELTTRLAELHDRMSRSPFPTFSRAPISAVGRPAPRRAPWLARALIGAGVVAVVAGAAWWVTTRPSAEPARPEASAVAAASSTVAVLPFVSLSDEQGNDYFSDGLTEELSATLTKGNALRVVARTSAYAFKGKNLTVQQIGAQLRAGTLIEGSVRKSGGLVKVIVHLVNASDGFRIWTGEYERPLADIFLIHADLARDIVMKLLPTAAASRLAPVRPTTRVVDAYDAYLRGRSFQVKSVQRENLEQALKFFKTTTELDPNYALGWARYGEVLSRWLTMGYDDSKEKRQAARDAIDRALQLDADLPEAHRALADYYTIDWVNQSLAGKELMLAVRALPNDADLLSALAASYLNRGKKAETVEYMLRATSLDPQNGDLANNCALALEFASRYPEAVAERERAFQLGGWNYSIVQKALYYRNWKGDLALVMNTMKQVEPADGPETDSSATYWRLRAGYEQARGDFSAAQASLARIQRPTLANEFYLYPKAFLTASLLEAEGKTAEARAAYTEALTQAEPYRDSQPRRVRAHTTLALIYAALGRIDDARAAVAQCLALIPPDDNPYVASRTGRRVQAQVEARAGKLDTALEIVRSQIAAGFWKRHDLLLDNDWALLRKDARFMELARNAPL